MSGAPELNQVTGRNVPPSAAGLDLLFAALFATSFGAYAAGNLLLLNGEVLFATSMIMLPICAFWCVFYSLSRLSGNVLLGACLTLLAVWLAVLSLAYGGGVAFAVGAGVAAVHLFRACRIPKATWTFVVAMAVVGAAAALSSPGVFTYFDNLDWAKGRYMHPDVAFHVAIAAMIKNYGVVSTGLHGLVETPYYALLHHFSALMSALSGQGVLEVWGFQLSVFCVPLLMFAVCYAATSLTARDCVTPMAWSLVCLVLVSPQLLVGKLMALQFVFFSETYVFSIALLLLCLPLLAKPVFNWPDVLLAFVATAVVAYAKGTTAVMLAGLFAARWLFIEKAKLGLGLIASALSALTLAVFVFGITKSTVAAQDGLTIDILRIVRMGPGGNFVSELVTGLAAGRRPELGVSLRAIASTLFFFATHFALSWIALAAFVRLQGWRSLYTDARAVLVWSSAFGGIIFAVFFSEPGGIGIWYFTSVPFFVALPILVGIAAARFEVPDKPITQLLPTAVVLLVILGTSYHAYYRQSFLAPMRRELPKEDAFVSAMLALRKDTPSNAIIKADDKAWLIEPTYCEDQPDQYPAPFVFAALSERAWVNIIRPLELGGYPYRAYGFAFYGIGPSGFERPVPPLIPEKAFVMPWSPSRGLLDSESDTAARIAASWRKIFGASQPDEEEK